MRKSLPERFWEKVLFTPGCWIWQASMSGNGSYGQFSVGDAMQRAHRVAYTLFNGRIPDGLVIDHLCRNRACVRPDHLEAVSQEENVRRGIVGENNRSKTECKRGHKFDADNTSIRYRDGRVERSCKRCSREQLREYRSRKHVQ